MKARVDKKRLLLAALALSAAVLACAALLDAQEAHGQTGQAVTTVSDGSGNAAVAAWGAEAILHSRTMIDGFFDQFTNVVCNEDVTQYMVGKNGKAFYHEESVFEYQVQADRKSGSLKLVENRETRKEAFRDPAKPLLITNGFATLLLVLHPDFESSYVFTPVSEENIDGRAAVRVHFKPVAGASSPAALQLRGRNYPLPLTGDVWLDRESSVVLKLVASLDGTFEDLGLRGLSAEIRYAPVTFHEPDETYWMPRQATIDVETPKQHWRNVHRFSSYHRFHSTTQQVLGAEAKP